MILFFPICYVNGENISSSKDILVLGSPAPEVAGINLFDKQPISLSGLKGKYVLLDFWATTCGPCIREFYFIREAYQKYDRNKFEVVGIVDDRTNGKIMDFLKEKEVIWPTITRFDESTIVNDYKFDRYPASYLIDPDGNLVETNLRGRKLFEVLDRKIKE